jgi:hypothetical protein
MQKLLRSGRRYLKTMDLTDMSALKVCLLSLGILIGLFIPSRSKKSAGLLMGILFAGTYVTLMSRFFAVMSGGPADEG